MRGFMSKDGNLDTSEFDPLANKEYTEEQKQKEFLSQTTTPELEADDGFIVTSTSSAQSTPSISALSGNISPDSQTSDPITKAVGEIIIQPQKDNLIEQILKDLAALTDRDLAEQKRKEIEEEKDKDKTLSTFFGNPANREFIDKALENPELKKKLESIEIAGYKNVHNTFSAASGYPGGFKPVQWENQVSASDLRATVVKNDAGDELCTLNETTVKTKPFTVAKQDGTQVQISSYREIDFPIKLDKADGSMHLSMVALKADGTKPSKDKAVYFTAHYEEGPNGKPQLKEISSPKPLKFAGTGDDAIAYIEHGGEIYTLAVTRGKYKEMMKELELNQGQSVDLSQAEDIIIGQGQSKEQPLITPQQTASSSVEPPQYKQQVPPITPTNQPLQTKASQMPQSQQVNPNLLNAATVLSGSMQDLLHYVNAGLTKEIDSNKQIDLIKEAAKAILNNEKSDIAEKQTNIIALAENTVNNKNLTPDAKVAGVNAVLETIKNDQNTPDLEKSKMLEATVAIALNSENLEPKQKQQMLEKAVDVGLSLKDDASRAAAIDGITDAVIKSLSTEDKGIMLIAVGDKVNVSELSNAEKQKLLGSVLKKGVEVQVLSPAQQQLMQQNLDKITAEQTKKDTIKKVNDILFDPLSNTELKTTNIQAITSNVLDGPATAEVKGEIIQEITNTVAGSSLEAQDKAEIVKGVGETVATHSDTSVSLPNKALIMASAEKGIAESKTNLPDRELMTKGLVDGIYEGKGGPEITKAVSSGIDNSNIKDSEKEALKKAKDAASEAALDRETQNLTEGLKGQNIEEHKPRDDIYNKAQEVINAVNPVIEALEKSKAPVVSAEERIVQETSSILNNISKLAVEKVNNFRAILSSNGNLKTLAEKKEESIKKVDELVKEFGTKSSTEEQQSFIKANLIDAKTLSKEVRLQTIDKLLQEQAQKRAEAIENPSVKTEDVRVVSGKSELKPISKDKPDTEKAKMVVGRDRVNIKENIKIMEALMNARDSIQSENLNKSTPIKRESSPPQR
uniref:Antigenic heat-stable 120 kDa protein n=7 Tax=Rickettsia TaxID=780 RepID=A0A7D7PNY2_RICCR|nr:cell surface antigen 4 [Rickettsia conorii subsp. raoultii]WCB70154.1 surface cell antigen 4 [Rickettsia conorii subsp. raoultii]WCB70155.1 surface cell antigen 4 [Rickettsia conorii subsp. raoultii]WCB70156.1 surface cell antigen 4 [Rickettsia conorii subsp. raoultii]WCB70157.1 surface cell antigen 4 [Rickettsia conorii subsp. raoultii]